MILSTALVIMVVLLIVRLKAVMDERDLWKASYYNIESEYKKTWRYM